MLFNEIRIGHYSNTEARTGVTVFIFPKAFDAAYFLCGSAPATRDVLLLNCDNFVSQVDGFVFSGGSAFGLGASNGLMQYLQEQGRGLATLAGPVPIVPAAAIYDLQSGDNTFPSPEQAYWAAEQACTNNLSRGSLGAGTGATVGKLFSTAQSMPGGFGIQSAVYKGGLKITVAVVLNCVGDVYDQGGKIIAGAREGKKGFLDLQACLARGEKIDAPLKSNTSLVLVFCNAQLTQAALSRVAKMASAGLARAIKPAFSLYDGDIVFAASSAEVEADEIRIGCLAAELLHQAILNALDLP